MLQRGAAKEETQSTLETFRQGVDNISLVCFDLEHKVDSLQEEVDFLGKLQWWKLWAAGPALGWHGQTGVHGSKPEFTALCGRWRMKEPLGDWGMVQVPVCYLCEAADWTKAVMPWARGSRSQKGGRARFSSLLVKCMAYTTQSNLQIWCNPYQHPKNIFHRTRTNNYNIYTKP